MAFIPVNEPLLNGNEKKYLAECIDTGWISSEGPMVTKFEDMMGDLCQRQYGIAVANGSVAIDMAIAALGIGKGDEVIMPTFTIISCAAAVVRAGAIPVVVDSLPDTWNMDVSKIESKITKKTKAIMIVHIYGHPVDVDPILDLAKKHELYVIEDAAEMHGQTYKGKPCGSFGDISTLSFYPNKHVTTGEGGMVLTDDEELAERCKSLRNLCFKSQRRFVHEELGWNFRMSNLQAAVGVAQAERLPEFIKIKRAMGKRYTEAFQDLKKLRLPLVETDFSQNIYWVYGMVIDVSSGMDAVAAMQILAKKGIGCRPFFWCMHEQPVLQKMGFFTSEYAPVAENLARQGFYIPSGLGLTAQQQDVVIHAVREVFR